MTLIKTSLLNAIAVVIKMLTLLGINKVLAIYVGPAGYAAIGQFQNAVQMITTVASGAINTGVTKYTAEYYDNEVQQRLVWQTAGTIALIGSLITSFVIAIFNSHLALWFLKDSTYGGVFLWFAGTLVLFTFNTLLLAILNGKKEINRYVLANIAGSIFSFVITMIMAMEYGLYGALVALAIYQSISFFITLILCYKAPWFKIEYLVGGVDKKTVINLSKYTAMALTSAACIPVSHILIRNHLGETLGWDAAGYWEAMWRLSGAYLLLITTTLSVYFLPRFSEITDVRTIKREVYNGYKIILPLTFFGCILIYYLKDFVIPLLFSKSFMGMSDLFAFQLIGDFFKVASWIIGFVFVSKARYKLFMFIELFFSAQFLLLTYFFTFHFGLEGAAIAHAVNYFTCLAFVLTIFWRGNERA